METTIQGEGPETVAEIIIEPVMSGVGVAVPPDDYLPAVADLCKQYGILLHVDEVINGFGRTGKLFGHQHYGVKPDIIALAKGISSAYLPMAATVISNRVFQSFVGDPADNRQVNQVNTYGGHPVAAAVAARNIEILLEEKLTESSAENGAYLLDALGTLKARHRWIGDVRGKGLYAGVELVTDRATKAVVPAAQIKQIVERCQERGVIVGRSGGGRHLGNTIILAPPLVLTRPEIDRIVTVLDQTIPEVCGAAA
jgi:adenosylmethionine-8-amino-7-oxononanoate aminotransferase